MNRVGTAWAICLGLLAGSANAAPSAIVVGLDLATQHRLGVQTAPLVAQKRKSQIDAFAKVGWTPAPLAALDSDLNTAIAAAAASRAEAVRSKALNAAGGVVSSKDAEAAEIPG